MGSFRYTIFSRIIAGLLALSMIAILAAPTWSSRQAATSVSYATWIRTQLRLPADAAVEMALDRAVQARVSAFDDFVAAFVQAYEEQTEDRPLSLIFLPREISGEALMQYLLTRYHRVLDNAVVARASLVSAIAAASGAQGMAAGSMAVAVGFARTGMVRMLDRSLDLSFVDLFRVLSSARPHGP